MWAVVDKRTRQVVAVLDHYPKPDEVNKDLAKVFPVSAEARYLWEAAEQDGRIIFWPWKEVLGEEVSLTIDRETASRINEQIHPECPIEEQIGILRDQLVHVLNALGIEPTPEFARLNEIAIKEIEAGLKKKEELNAQSDSA